MYNKNIKIYSKNKSILKKEHHEHFHFIKQYKNASHKQKTPPEQHMFTLQPHLNKY